MSEAPEIGGSVMLTGGTGFVASHLLHALLSAGEAAFVFARRRRDESAEVRVGKALERAAACYCESVDPGALARLRVIPGDVTEPYCGVDAAEREKLVGRVSEFWHFAANLTFDDRYARDVDRDNRQGTEHALDLALALGVKRFVFCSTAFVAGLRTGDVPEALNDDTTPFSNAYERSKNAAEWLVVKRCQEAGIDYHVVRPSIVVGPFGTKQSGGSDSGMYEVVREVHRLRDQLRPLGRPIHFDGRAETPLNIVPVDWLVKDFLALRQAGFGGRVVTHLCAADCPTVQDAFDVMSELMDLPPIEVGPQPARRRAPVERLLNRRVEYYNSYVTYGKRFARTLQPVRNVSREDLRAYIVRYVRELEGEVRELVFRREPVVSFDGYSIDVFEAGPERGEPVVFVNSYGMPVDFWLPLARVLEDTCRILTWESRGVPSVHGPVGEAPLVPSNHVRDLETLMKERGYESAHLIGWCTGSEVALAFASDNPERVRSLVLMNGAYSGGLRTGFQDTLCSITKRIAADERYAEFYYRVIYGTELEDSVEATRKMDALLSEVDPALLYMAGVPFRSPSNLFRYANLVEGFFKAPLTGRPDRVRCPVLVVSSTHDHLTRYENSVELASRIAGASIDLQQGGDHYRMYYDRELMRRIGAFIKPAGERLEFTPDEATAPRVYSALAEEGAGK